VSSYRIARFICPQCYHDSFRVWPELGLMTGKPAPPPDIQCPGCRFDSMVFDANTPSLTVTYDAAHESAFTDAVDRYIRDYQDRPVE